MSSRSLLRRLERLEKQAIAADVGGNIKVVILNSSNPEDPMTMIGPDGQEVWWRPPAGCRRGDPIEKPAESSQQRGLSPTGVSKEIWVVFEPLDLPTTAIGADGQLVWLKPPEGCEPGDPVNERGQDWIALADLRDLRPGDCNPQRD